MEELFARINYLVEVYLNKENKKIIKISSFLSPTREFEKGNKEKALEFLSEIGEILGVKVKIE